ncbi:hypothetical protein Sjap_003345 [Stephania japonica]|uniref:Tf2-1-like SH3-like domain-containing protein n=1 Tax=Stephania japonica TaxID=461633 RepID=A0AAP0KR78_9MAGN
MRQKRYADRHHRFLEYSKDDYVLLKVSPMKGLYRFGLRGKLAPRYIGPFRILARIGPVAYRLDLPPQLAGVHNVFHVSMLRKAETRFTPRVDWNEFDLREDLSYDEQPIQILDHKIQKLRTKEISLVKVKWQFHGNEELTWERESYMREQFPFLFEVSGNLLFFKFRGRNTF